MLFHIVKIAPPHISVSSPFSSLCVYPLCVWQLDGLYYLAGNWDTGGRVNLNDNKKSLGFLNYLSPCPSLKENLREI